MRLFRPRKPATGKVYIIKTTTGAAPTTRFCVDGKLHWLGISDGSDETTLDSGGE